VPPVGRVFDGHHRSQQTAAVTAGCALALCERRTLLITDPSIEHV